MKTIKENTYKGTRILIGNYKRNLINEMIKILISEGYTEISIPIIQHVEMFENKVGDENRNMMFTFTDRGDRQLCLAPEYTAVVQSLKNTFNNQKDVKLFYVQECFRGEKPQSGRYRQFTQLGIEIINPTQDYNTPLQILAGKLIGLVTRETSLNPSVTRGLDYYKEGKGFEITSGKLGAQSQICGGGEYDGGVGFAIGIDRLLLLNK
jgi:histidyl-tRNA synthetase